MSRNRFLLLVGSGLAIGFLVVRLRTPTPSPEPRPAPPVEAPPKPALQADAEGYYVPGYQFTVNRFRFTGFSLRPEALVSFAQMTVPCLEALIRADTFHLRCDDPQVGTVTIDGKFLTRFVTSRLDAAVVSAVVTVRDGSGDIVYSARDSFVWHPGD